MKLHKEQERICRELGNVVGLQASFGNQALILKARGNLDGAMALHKEQEQICRKLENIQTLALPLANQKLILVKQDRHIEAVRMIGEAYTLALGAGYGSLIAEIRGIIEEHEF